MGADGGKDAHSEESVEGAVLHVLGDDHDGVGLGDHALQEDDVGVLELAHDAGLGEEVHARFVRAARLQRFDGDVRLGAAHKAQLAAAHVAELAAADDCLDGDARGVDLARELTHRLVRVLVGVRVDVGARGADLGEKWSCHC